MSLPKSISPCPIKDATAEVRFETVLPDDAVFGIVYKALGQRYSQVEPLPILTIPKEMRDRNPELAKQPHYKLIGLSSVLLVGPRMVAVGIHGDYPGWSSFVSEIKASMETFNTTGILKVPVRFGLRYVSFFAEDIFSKLQLRFLLASTSLDGEETQFKTVLHHPDCRTLVQVAKGVALVANPNCRGSVIDLDCFIDQPQGDFLSSFNTFLETAHAREKELFFSLLTPDFLATLNPAYEP